MASTSSTIPPEITQSPKKIPFQHQNTFTQHVSGSIDQKLSQLSMNSTIFDIKSQLSSINQQLSIPVRRGPEHNNLDQITQHQSTLIQLSSQLEQQCDQVLILQNQSDLQLQHIELKLQQQQLELKQTQIDFQQLIQQQQLQFQQELKQQYIDLQEQMKQQRLELKQQQIDFDTKVNQQQFKLDQQVLELKQQQINIEQQQQQFQIKCERYELQQQQQLSNNNNNISSQSQLLMEQSNVDILNQGQSNTIDVVITTNPTISDVNNNSLDHFKDLLIEVVEDYQAMKYLVEQTTTSNQVLNTNCKLIPQYVTQIQQIKDDVETAFEQFTKIEVKLIDKMHQFDELEAKIVEKTAPNDAQLNEHTIRIKLLEQVCKEQIQQYEKVTTMVINQRKQVPLILEANKKQPLGKEYVFICFQFENLKDVRISCASWSSGHYYGVFYNEIVSNYLKNYLESFKPTIEKSKLYISSKSVLDGEWVQIQGEGTVLNFKTVNFHHLIKPGDDIYDYKDYPCMPDCTRCKGNPGDKTSKRFLIKFRWE